MSRLPEIEVNKFSPTSDQDVADRIPNLTYPRHAPITPSPPDSFEQRLEYVTSRLEYVASNCFGML